MGKRVRNGVEIKKVEVVDDHGLGPCGPNEDYYYMGTKTGWVKMTDRAAALHGLWWWLLIISFVLFVLGFILPFWNAFLIGQFFVVLPLWIVLGPILAIIGAFL